MTSLPLRVWYAPDPHSPNSDVQVIPVQTMADVVALFDGFQELADHLIRQGKPDRATWGADRYEPDGDGGHAWFEIDTNEIREARAFLNQLAA